MSTVLGSMTVSIEADDRPSVKIQPYAFGSSVHRDIQLTDGAASAYVNLSVTILAEEDPGTAAAYLRELAAQAQALAADIEQSMKAAAAGG